MTDDFFREPASKLPAEPSIQDQLAAEQLRQLKEPKKPDSVLRHPLLITVVGFVLTVAVGSSFAQYYQQQASLRARAADIAKEHRDQARTIVEREVATFERIESLEQSIANTMNIGVKWRQSGDRAPSWLMHRKDSLVQLSTEEWLPLRRRTGSVSAQLSALSGFNIAKQYLQTVGRVTQLGALHESAAVTSAPDTAQFERLSNDIFRFSFDAFVRLASVDGAMPEDEAVNRWHCLELADKHTRDSIAVPTLWMPRARVTP